MPKSKIPLKAKRRTKQDEIEDLRGEVIEWQLESEKADDRLDAQIETNRDLRNRKNVCEVERRDAEAERDDYRDKMLWRQRRLDRAQGYIDRMFDLEHGSSTRRRDYTDALRSDTGLSHDD